MNESPILGVIYCVWKVNCGVAKSGEVKRLKILIPEHLKVFGKFCK